MFGTAMMMLAQVVAPESLMPTGNWTLDDQAGCTLSRPYSSSAGPVTFAAIPPAGAAEGKLVLVMPGRVDRYEVDEGTVTLNADGATFPTVWSRVAQRGRGYTGVTVRPGEGFWNALPDAKRLTMDVSRFRRVTFEVGAMGSVAAALNACRAEKLAALPAKRR
jgi:hypothetical protein